MNKRQKKKNERTRNRKLVERYPFLLPYNCWDDTIPKDYHYEYTNLDCMPEGWKKAFGKELLEDLRKELLKHNYLHDFRIMQLKEKFGELRIYTNGIPKDCEVDDIIDKYTVISRHICIRCGKLDTPIISNNGWYEPICKSCYDRGQKAVEQYYKNSSTIPYEKKIEKLKPEHFSIPNSYKVSCYSCDGTVEKEIDISDIVERIRKKKRAK